MSLKLPQQPVYLKACGVTTSVGLTAEQTAVSIRAGISAFAESSIYNKRFDPMIMALIPDEELPTLDQSVLGQEERLTARQNRLIRIAHLALLDLSSKHPELDGLPLIFAGPEKLYNDEEILHENIIQHLTLQTGINFHDQHNSMLAQGRAGGVRALQYAMAYLEAGLSDYAIVGGVDSYLDLYLLGVLDVEDRVLAEGVMNGFAPGEGAGFLLLSRNPEKFQASEKQILIYPPGLSVETGHRFSELPYQGDGLANSFTQALQYSDVDVIHTIFSSLNGENFGAKELGVASTRNSDKVNPDCAIEHPSDCYGDVGAACFPINISLSAIGCINEYIKPPILNYASSETEYRGAACLSIG